MNYDTKQKVHGIVHQLFTRQLRHAVQCEKILRQLFTMERQENMPIRIKINENILKGGLAALNRINAEVRQVLIQYYSDCESMYLVGVKHIEHQGIAEAEAQAKAKAKAKAQAEAEAHPQVQRGPPIPAQGPPPPPIQKEVRITNIPRPIPSAPPLAQPPVQPPAQPSAQPPAQPPITAAQQAAQRGQQISNTYKYMDEINPILKEKFKGEKLASNTIQSIRTYLSDKSQRIPVEQLQTMTKDQIRGLITQGSRRITRGMATKMGGFTRKHTTSSFRTTHRLSR